MVKFLVALKVVRCAGIVEKYALIALIIYLTDVWGLRLLHAAGFINLWIGTTKLMPFAFIFLIDNYIRNSYAMIIMSTVASGLGMGLLWISTPSRVYSRLTGSCNEYTMKCISESQKSLFYLALLLIMIGISAREATMETIKFKGNVFQRELTKLFVTSSDRQVTIVVGLLFSIVKSWSIQFGVSAVCSFVALYLVMGKTWSHKLDVNEPEKIFAGSVFETFKDLPNESTGIYKDVEKDDPRLHNSSRIRLLENSKDTKSLVRMLPVAVVFVFMGLLSSMVNTYFVKQAQHLNSSIILWNPFNSSIFIWIPLDPSLILGKYLGVSQLYLIYEYSKSQFQKYTRKPINIESKGTYSHSRDMQSAMMYAILCCSAAALAENSRLKVISKLENIIPMRTFWLIPQFLFLGMADGLMERSMEMFFIKEMPWSMRNYGILVSKGFMGLGTVSSVLFVCVIGKMSGMGGRPSWFQHNMEKSRLDLFYWLLMVLCVVVLVTWVVLSKRVKSAWHKGHRRRLECKKDDIRKVLVPGRDMSSIEDGEIGDQVIEAVIVEYFVMKTWNKNLATE